MALISDNKKIPFNSPLQKEKPGIQKNLEEFDLWLKLLVLT